MPERRTGDRAGRGALPLEHFEFSSMQARDVLKVEGVP
jgi:hypothetical protein